MCVPFLYVSFRRIASDFTGAQCTPLQLMRCELDLRVGTDILVRPRANAVRPYGDCAPPLGLCKIRPCTGRRDADPYGIVCYFTTFRRDSPRGCPFWAATQSPLWIANPLSFALICGTTQRSFPTGLRFVAGFVQVCKGARAIRESPLQSA